MLTEYIRPSRRPNTKMENGRSSPSRFQGLWAEGNGRGGAAQVISTLEDWVLLAFRFGDSVPVVGGIDFKKFGYTKPVSRREDPSARLSFDIAAKTHGLTRHWQGFQPFVRKCGPAGSWAQSSCQKDSSAVTSFVSTRALPYRNDTSNGWTGKHSSRRVNSDRLDLIACLKFSPIISSSRIPPSAPCHCAIVVQCLRQVCGRLRSPAPEKSAGKSFHFTLAFPLRRIQKLTTVIVKNPDRPKNPEPSGSMKVPGPIPRLADETSKPRRGPMASEDGEDAVNRS